MSDAKELEGQLLRTAVLMGDIDGVRKLLAQDVDVNAPDPEGETALHHAVRGPHLEIVALLLAHGADIMQRNEWGMDCFGIIDLNISWEADDARGRRIENEQAGNAIAACNAMRALLENTLLEREVTKAKDTRLKSRITIAPLRLLPGKENKP